MEAGEKDSAIAAEIDLLDLDLDLVLTALELDALSATEDSTATCHHGTDDSWSSDDDPFVQSPFLEESSCVASSVSTHNSLSPTVQDSSLSDSVTSEKKTSDMPQVMIVQKEEAFDGEDASILSVVKYKGPKKNAWSFRLRQLLTFVEVYGRYPTKTDKVICHVGAKLYNWVNKHRNQYKLFVSGKKSLLGPSRIEALDAVHFDLGDTYGEEKWNEHFDQLKEFRERHGHCKVPVRDEKAGLDPAFQRWVSRQREHYEEWKNGDTSYLTDERVQKLDELDFVWFVFTRKENKKRKRS